MTRRASVVAILAVVLLAGCAMETAPSPSPTTPLTVRAADIPGVPVPGALVAAAPGGDGYVAIGFDGAFGTVLWTSADGTAWRDVTPDGFDGLGMVDLVVHGDRLVAVGRGRTLDIETELAAAWTSTDGLAWTEAESGEHMTGQLVGVVSTGGRLVGIGGVPGADAAGFWRSADGNDWERTPQTIDGAFGWSLVEGGPGLVAVGWRRNPEPSTAVWTSADGGETWALAPDPPDAAGFEATDVVATRGGTLVMVGGRVSGGEARIWRSTDDGASWTVVDVDGGLRDAITRAIVATPIGLVAVGAAGTDAAAWVSTDEGATWSALIEPIPDAYFDDALVTDDGLLFLGATQTGTPETGIEVAAAAWTATFDR